MDGNINKDWKIIGHELQLEYDNSKRIVINLNTKKWRRALRIISILEDMDDISGNSVATWDGSGFFIEYMANAEKAEDE